MWITLGEMRFLLWFQPTHHVNHTSSHQAFLITEWRWDPCKLNLMIVVCSSAGSGQLFWYRPSTRLVNLTPLGIISSIIHLQQPLTFAPYTQIWTSFEVSYPLINLKYQGVEIIVQQQCNGRSHWPPHNVFARPVSHRLISTLTNRAPCVLPNRGRNDVSRCLLWPKRPFRQRRKSEGGRIYDSRVSGVGAWLYEQEYRMQAGKWPWTGLAEYIYTGNSNRLVTITGVMQDSRVTIMQQPSSYMLCCDWSTVKR